MREVNVFEVYLGGRIDKSWWWLDAEEWGVCDKDDSEGVWFD